MLIRHTVYNLAGLGLPLLVAVATIPALIDALGPARFGLLALIWAVVSYFGLFDLGLGRAVTQQVSVDLAEGRHDRVASVVATSLALMAGLGALGGALLALLAAGGVALIRDVPDPEEARRAVVALAWALPPMVLTSGLRGVLEARRDFGMLNLIRLPLGLFTFLGPLAVVAWGDGRLDTITWVLTGGRYVGFVLHAWAALRGLPPAGAGPRFDPALVRPLVVAGGWLTVSNVISPIMGYVDRFIIGALVSATAVAFYATPHEIVTKLWIIPGALTAVLFPAFAQRIAMRDGTARGLYVESLAWVAVAMLPPCLVLFAFSREILDAWIGPDFADASQAIMKLLVLGLFVNCFAHVPFTLIQSAGAARTTALIHLCEFPAFVLLVWWLAGAFGAIGAALAWIVRMVVDTTLMFGAAGPLLGARRGGLPVARAAALAGSCAAAFAAAVSGPLALRLAIVAAASAICLAAGLRLLGRARLHSAAP